jgi:putative ABC transport system permease protein
MIKSYVIAAWRNIVRHKLFATINIIGLAISISVGLLIVSLVSDLRSYDNFHKNANRTYRIVTTQTTQGIEPEDYASSSVKTGKLIRESVAGVKEVTIVRKGVGGDISVGEKTVSIGTMYADNSFFNVFDFELSEGDRAKALAEPYSLVLTEPARKRLFGDEDAVGKLVRFNHADYVVTGVLRDLPHLTHLRFEGLVSLTTAELKMEQEFNDWTSIYSNYVYLVIDENTNPEDLQVNLDRIASTENILPGNTPKFSLSMQPLTEIAFGRKVTNQSGPVMPASAIWILIGLGLVVMISSCFNYTNLSIARALKRSREVGIRKISGALRTQVLAQFLTESIIISLLALVISFFLFLLLRPQFLSLHTFVESIVSLKLTVRTILYFITVGIVVGIVAGILPAVFFSRINLSSVLKGISPMQNARSFSLRKVIIVIQYIFSFVFITTTAIGYVQYKNFLSFDLGFTTANVLNIELQGNKPDIVKTELLKLGEVSDVSQSQIVVGLGRTYSDHVKYKSAADSTLTWMNIVDEKYLPLHQYELVSGRNFNGNSLRNLESEAIVTELFLKKLGIDTPNALGETVKVSGKDVSIIGVIRDFHYETVEDNIEPVLLLYSPEINHGYLNAKITTTNIPATMSKIEEAWKRIDKVHPLNAAWYDHQIEVSYSQYSMMIKVVSFLSVLAICIASLGLLGMVVFSTETRMREISIRKILGASESKLVLLLGRSFLVMLFIAALIALPATYMFFDVVVLSNFAYHVPIGAMELIASVAIVSAIAVVMIGSQTLRTARKNPSVVLRTE